MKPEAPPRYDSRCLNIVDPKDSLGTKTEYITLLQQKAMRRYYPTGEGLAVDVGCGYGRLTPSLARLGYREVVGLDPDLRLLEYAKQNNPGPHYIAGALPNLPLPRGSVQLLLFHNLLRLLKTAGALEALRGSLGCLNTLGRLVVVDNVWPGHGDYFEEDAIVDLVEAEGFRLLSLHRIRRARWWMVFPIRYGLIPRTWLDRIAQYELDKLANARSYSRWQYTNVVFVFGRSGDPHVASGGFSRISSR